MPADPLAFPPVPAASAFPLEQATVAREKIEILIERLREVLETHHRAAQEAIVDFEGRTRQDFDRSLERLTGSLDDHIRALRRQLDDLDEVVTWATVRRGEGEESMEEWQAEQWR